MRPTWLVALALTGTTTAGLGGPTAGSVEDDLTVVKKAVAAKPPATAALPAATAPAVAQAPGGAREEETSPALPRRGREPQWLRVRVTEKNGKKKVSVNLPLALVRVMGDDWPIHLRALESGRDLLQVDEEDATVRVWVE